MFAVPPGILAAGVSTMKTYADFQAHIATLATSGVLTWGASMASGAFRTTVGSFSGTMTGSTWLSFVDDSSSSARGIQHGLPSPTEVSNQPGRELFYRIGVFGAESNFVGLNRNGYSSASYNDGIDYTALTMTELIYWDGTQAQRMNPYAGTGPTPYTWT